MSNHPANKPEGPAPGDKVSIIAPQSAEVAILNINGKPAAVAMAIDNHSAELRRVYALTPEQARRLIGGLMAAVDQIAARSPPKLIMPAGSVMPDKPLPPARISITQTPADAVKATQLQ